MCLQNVPSCFTLRNWLFHFSEKLKSYYFESNLLNQPAWLWVLRNQNVQRNRVIPKEGCLNPGYQWKKKTWKEHSLGEESIGKAQRKGQGEQCPNIKFLNLGFSHIQGMMKIWPPSPCTPTLFLPLPHSPSPVFIFSIDPSMSARSILLWMT